MRLLSCLIGMMILQADGSDESLHGKVGEPLTDTGKRVFRR